MTEATQNKEQELWKTMEPQIEIVVESKFKSHCQKKLETMTMDHMTEMGAVTTKMDEMYIKLQDMKIDCNREEVRLEAMTLTLNAAHSKRDTKSTVTMNKE